MSKVAFGIISVNFKDIIYIFLEHYSPWYGEHFSFRISPFVFHEKMVEQGLERLVR